MFVFGSRLPRWLGEQLTVQSLVQERTKNTLAGRDGPWPDLEGAGHHVWQKRQLLARVWRPGLLPGRGRPVPLVGTAGHPLDTSCGHCAKQMQKQRAIPGLRAVPWNPCHPLAFPSAALSLF